MLEWLRRKKGKVLEEAERRIQEALQELALF